MNWQTNDGRAARTLRSGEATASSSTQSPGRREALQRDFMPLRRSLLVLAGAAAVVFGCQQDRADTASEDVRPSAIGRQTDDTSPSGVGGEDESPAEDQVTGEGDEGDEAPGGTSATGTGTTGTTGTGTTGTGTSGTGTTGGGTTGGGASGGGSGG